MRGDLARAEEHGRTAVQLNPNMLLAAPFLAATLAQQGRTDAARAVVAEYRRRHPDISIERLASILPRSSPDYVAGRDRMFAALRELGMP